jgi:hypothetical protein
MDTFLQSYGLWILLAGVFLAMHWFGMGCGGHRHGRPPPSEDTRTRSDGATERPAHSGHSGGCH